MIKEYELAGEQTAYFVLDKTAYFGVERVVKTGSG